MWLEDERENGRCLERAFALESSGERVPGVFWRPQRRGLAAPPLVLLGHGGSGDKRSERNVQLAGWFAAEAGLACVAIDGPYHGERVSHPLSAAVYQALVAQEGMEAVAQRISNDWCAVVDELGERRLVDATQLGYVGLSMGTRFGLPLAGELGDRLRCLVIGKFGLQQHPDMDPGLLDRELFSAAARSIVAPTLFHLQRDDEIFPRPGQLELFGLLGSQNKQLLEYPGAHAQTPPEAITSWQAFVADHLDKFDPESTATP